MNARVLVRALKKAGANPTRALVRQALEGLGQINLGGYALNFSQPITSGHISLI